MVQKSQLKHKSGANRLQNYKETKDSRICLAIIENKSEKDYSNEVVLQKDLQIADLREKQGTERGGEGSVVSCSPFSVYIKCKRMEEERTILTLSFGS